MCCADVQESAPTADQLASILEYLGPAQAGSVIADATGTTDALKKFKANESLFKAPVTVDWMNARAGMFTFPTARDASICRSQGADNDDSRWRQRERDHEASPHSPQGDREGMSLREESKCMMERC